MIRGIIKGIFGRSKQSKLEAVYLDYLDAKNRSRTLRYSLKHKILVTGTPNLERELERAKKNGRTYLQTLIELELKRR